MALWPLAVAQMYAHVLSKPALALLLDSTTRVTAIWEKTGEEKWDPSAK